MVDVKPLRIEKGVVRGLHLQHGVDLFIRPACGGVSIVQTVVGIPCFLHTVVFIALRHVDVDRHAVFCNGRKTAVPLGCSMQISCIQVRPHGNCPRHGFAASRVACGVNAGGIYGKVIDEILRQSDGLPRRSVAPVGELGGHYDHILSKVRPAGEPRPVQIAAGGRFPEPHHVIAGHDHHHGVAFPAPNLTEKNIIIELCELRRKFTTHISACCDFLHGHLHSFKIS